MTTKLQGAILSDKKHTLAYANAQIRVTGQTTGDLVPLFYDYSLTRPAPNPFFTNELGLYEIFYDDVALADTVAVEEVTPDLLLYNGVYQPLSGYTTPASILAEMGWATRGSISTTVMPIYTVSDPDSVGYDTFVNMVSEGYTTTYGRSFSGDFSFFYECAATFSDIVTRQPIIGVSQSGSVVTPNQLPGIAESIGYSNDGVGNIRYYPNLSQASNQNYNSVSDYIGVHCKRVGSSMTLRFYINGVFVDEYVFTSNPSTNVSPAVGSHLKQSQATFGYVNLSFDINTGHKEFWAMPSDLPPLTYALNGRRIA